MTTTVNVGELLNLVGLSMGVVLYAMLLVMVVAFTPGIRRSRTRRSAAAWRLPSSVSSGTRAHYPRMTAENGCHGPFPVSVRHRYLARSDFCRRWSCIRSCAGNGTGFVA